MVFSYYKNLSKTQKAVYRASDQITRIKIPNPAVVMPAVNSLKRTLAAADQAGVTRQARDIASQLMRQFEVAPVRIKVLSARPHDDYGELHGFYERSFEGRSWPLIVLWMRTAKKKQVVAFKTFLRTLLHELGHHLDYELLRLSDSYHTEGFYQRESMLLKQLMEE